METFFVMLAVSPLRRDERKSEMEIFSISGGDEFPDFSTGGNLLDSIDFDDIFVGIDDEDVLPDLELDSEIFAEFSLSTNGSGADESSQMTTSMSVDKLFDQQSRNEEAEKSSYNSASDEHGTNSSGTSTLTQGGDDVAMSKSTDQSTTTNPSQKEGEKVKKSSSQAKNPNGKRKVKVDWTPELHRRFVQAVEQLGVDKAVPSRILELMGIDCLTRHNIASHLQKYRSHRKHLLAREAEAANWTQKRQMYAGGATTGAKRDISPWLAPTIGFPPMAPLPHFRPLHVWGHPSVDQSLMPVWPKHLGPPPPPPPTWPPAASHPVTPPLDPSFWHAHHHQRVPNTLTTGAPCFPPHLAPARFPTPPVPGIPPPGMYKVDPGIGVPTAPAGQPVPQTPIDFHPSTESIDAAIGDVLSKPWQPLPLGLKPPSVDSVLGELQRQGVSKIPPAASG